MTTFPSFAAARLTTRHAQTAGIEHPDLAERVRL